MPCEIHAASEIYSYREQMRSCGFTAGHEYSEEMPKIRIVRTGPV